MTELADCALRQSVATRPHVHAKLATRKRRTGASSAPPLRYRCGSESRLMTQT